MAEGGKAGVDLEIVIAAEFERKEIPSRLWLVRDLVPDHHDTLLSGDGGVGKSLLALQLCVAASADVRLESYGLS